MALWAYDPLMDFSCMGLPCPRHRWRFLEAEPLTLLPESSLVHSLLSHGIFPRALTANISREVISDKDKYQVFNSVLPEAVIIIWNFCYYIFQGDNKPWRLQIERDQRETNWQRVGDLCQTRRKTGRIWSCLSLYQTPIFSSSKRRFRPCQCDSVSRWNSGRLCIKKAIRRGRQWAHIVCFNDWK